MNLLFTHLKPLRASQEKVVCVYVCVSMCLHVFVYVLDFALFFLFFFSSLTQKS